MLKNVGVVLAGTNSGCGKTTISAGIMAALTRRGIKVQPFKVGPDYIDPMFHTYVTGRYSRNLDSWMLDENTVKHLYLKNTIDCDIAITEGVMGFYDGYGGSSLEASTAHVAGIIKCPVVLIINAHGMSLSAAAMIKGFMEFTSGVNVRGVILNRVNSYGLFTLLKEVIEENTGAKVLGYLPESDEYTLPERHLGLVPGCEVGDLEEKLSKLADIVEKNIDLDALLNLANEAEEMEDTISEVAYTYKGKRVRIAVAYDSSFNFYYRDNLELLETMGAELVYFSPINDLRLPDGIDGLYLGGGYPEIFAKELEQNITMRNDIKSKLLAGLPAYAECGGLIYLCDTLTDLQGKTYSMVGYYSAHSEMTTSLKRFGYININICYDCLIGKAGYSTRGHEFHYSIVKNNEENNCYNVEKKRKTGDSAIWNDGMKKNNTLAGYPHIHFWSNPKLAQRLIENCIRLK